MTGLYTESERHPDVGVGRVVVVGIAVVVDIAEVRGRVRRLKPPVTAITADNRKKRNYFLFF